MHLIYKFCSGKTYIGMMPSGMRVAIKRLKEGVEVCHFLDEICEKAKNKASKFGRHYWLLQ
jgi:hypothetical protein